MMHVDGVRVNNVRDASPLAIKRTVVNSLVCAGKAL